MQQLQADIELALAHIEQVEELIKQQQARIDRLREEGLSAKNGELLLAALVKSHDMLKQHLAHLRRLQLVPQRSE
jgi:L-lysine 2,3-aminomutase